MTILFFPHAPEMALLINHVLRRRLEQVVDHLIEVLDILDNDTELEIDVDFEDGGDMEDGGDDEPSLGWASFGSPQGYVLAANAADAGDLTASPKGERRVARASLGVFRNDPEIRENPVKSMDANEPENPALPSPNVA